MRCAHAHRGGKLAAKAIAVALYQISCPIEVAIFVKKMYRFFVFFNRERRSFPSFQRYSGAILYRRIHHCLIETSQQFKKCITLVHTFRIFQTCLFKLLTRRNNLFALKCLCIKCNRIWKVSTCH